MGLKDFYYLLAKYMECIACNGTYIAYDERYNRCVQFVCNNNSIYIMNRILCQLGQYPSAISSHIDTEVCV